MFAIGSGGPGHHMKRERDRERERASFYCTAYAHAYKNISVQGGERSPTFLFYFLFLFPRDSTPHSSHAARTKAVRPSSAEGGDTKAALRSVQSRDLFPVCVVVASSASASASDDDERAEAHIVTIYFPFPRIFRQLDAPKKNMMKNTIVIKP